MSSPPIRVAMTLEQSWHRVPGGTAVAGIGMAAAVAARAGVDVVGVSARHGGPPAREWTPPVPVRPLPLPRALLYETWHRLRWPRVERATGRVDVIHATSIAIPPRSAPLAVTIHDLAFLRDPSHFTPRGLRFFRRGLELARSEADVVLCPSNATLSDCAAQGIDADRLRLVPLGVDHRAASAAEQDAVRTRWDLRRPFVLWVGTIEPRKNLRGLLDAFAKVGGERDLVLAGPEGWNEDVAGLGGDDVRLLGFVARSELAALYAAAEVLCFPSFDEGFGFPVLEAMAQGTPVVTSRGTSTEELAGGAGVLVDPRDPGSIADGLATVLDDPELAGRLGEKGKRRAAEYTWERTGAMLEDVYRELAA